MSGQLLDVATPGGRRLSLRLDLPADGAPVAWALFAHCFTCDTGLDAAIRLSRALAEERIAVARLDFTGRDEARGAAARAAEGATPAAVTVADLDAVAEALVAEGRAPQILLGHSLGGAAMIVAAPRIESARALVAIAAPADPLAVGQDPTYEVTPDLVADLRAPAILDALRASSLPLLILHSPADDAVPIEEAASLYTAARHPKSFVSLDDADHMLTREADAQYAAAVTAGWVRRYVDVQPHRPRVELERGTQVVTSTGATGFRTEILAGGHPLVADEPESVGGTETGPSPYDLLAAALGACTSMTLQMYARRKGWPLEEAIVRLQHRKVHALDETQVPGTPVRLDHLDRELELVGPLDDAQRARLAEIADRCPVHRTLEQGVTVETKVKGGE